MAIVPSTREAYEFYKRIKNFPKYKIGKDGSVWSKQSGKWKELKKIPTKFGHLKVTLRNNGKSEEKLVHRLVLEAFIGPCPPGKETRHYPDRNPANNKIENLSWSSAKVNQRDQTIQGTRKLGEALPHSKLTEKKVIKIRKMYSTGKYTQFELSVIFQISESTIGKVVNRDYWRHI